MVLYTMTMIWPNHSMPTQRFAQVWPFPDMSHFMGHDADDLPLGNCRSSGAKTTILFPREKALYSFRKFT